MHTHPSLILPTSFRGPSRSQSGRICTTQLSLGSGFQHTQMIRHINGLSCLLGSNLASFDVGDGDRRESSNRLVDCQFLPYHYTVHHRLAAQTMFDWCVLVWSGICSISHYIWLCWYEPFRHGLGRASRGRGPPAPGGLMLRILIDITAGRPCRCCSRLARLCESLIGKITRR